ncbi:hypothetical protein NPIL_141 [Nephila pilipes]|uniref:Uncharacterized protein n=1 Tax=Nephila pilipes TaxID=299642 RepID=A0A8X6UIW1_NEPPI|nr:hypothetical protein NPIL_141 [Nephila pilipes]
MGETKMARVPVCHTRACDSPRLPPALVRMGQMKRCRSQMTKTTFELNMAFSKTRSENIVMYAAVAFGDDPLIDSHNWVDWTLASSDR